MRYGCAGTETSIETCSHFDAEFFGNETSYILTFELHPWQSWVRYGGAETGETSLLKIGPR